MDTRTIQTGVQYETLLIRAYQLKYPSPMLGADRRLYYLLYYIKIGFDLRQTGYPAQFNVIKRNVMEAIEALGRQELHREEKATLRKLLKEMEVVWTESLLEKVISKALRITRRVDVSLNRELI